MGEGVALQKNETKVLQPIESEIISEMSIANPDFVECVQSQLDKIHSASAPGTGVVLENCVTAPHNPYENFCPNACPGLTSGLITLTMQVICGAKKSQCCMGAGGSVICGERGVCCINGHHDAYCCAEGTTCGHNACIAR